MALNRVLEGCIQNKEPQNGAPCLFYVLLQCPQLWGDPLLLRIPLIPFPYFRVMVLHKSQLLWVCTAMNIKYHSILLTITQLIITIAYTIHFVGDFIVSIV